MFARDVSVIERYMRTYAEASFAPQGLSFPEDVILMYLASHGTSNQESISSFLSIDKGSVAKTLGKLEEKGFVERTVNNLDRRQKLVALTREGARLLSEMNRLYGKLEETMFAGLTQDEIVQIKAAVARVAANLEGQNRQLGTTK